MNTDFRLSYWHSEIAKLIGEGLPNREIMKVIRISGPRLSVLRANPLIQQAATRYRQLHEDKYRKALEVFADSAEDVAKEIVTIAKNPLVPGVVRLAAGQAALEYASQVSPTGQQAKEGEELVFEQMLRVTKRGSGTYDSNQDELPAFAQEAQLQLVEDTEQDESGWLDDIIDESPKRVYEDVANSPLVA